MGRGGQEIIGLVGALTITLLFAFTRQDAPFYYDAFGYWELATTFNDGGSFSLLNFDHPRRGFAFPLVNLGLRDIARTLGWSDLTVVRVFNSAIIALISAVLAPRLASLAWPQRTWGVGARLLLMALLLAFWGGHVGMPMSDFPALALALIALIAAARPTVPACAFLAGLAAGAAVNVRPAYLLLGLVVALIVLQGWRTADPALGLSRTKKLIIVALLLGGFAVVSIPQAMIGHRSNQTWSFIPGAGDLSSLQLTAGLRMQRYDVLVGKDGTVPPQLVFDDETGWGLLAAAEWQVDGPREYLGLLFAHPAEMAGLLFRHAVHGLDLRYNGPYLEEFDSAANRPMRAAGFLLVVLALIRLVWPAARRTLGEAHWLYPAGLLACGLPALTSAVETRFFLPVFLSACLLVLAPGWANPNLRFALWRRGLLVPAILLAACTISLAIAFHVADQAVDDLRLEGTIRKEQPW